MNSNKSTCLALETEALYAKSQVYIRRGFRAKHDKDEEEYQLWASLALELLGKSTLSEKHPALIADPQHRDSLFAACGISISPDIKTIGAKTVFDRLKKLSRDFDKRIENYCNQFSLRRNSELHSGESPFSGMEGNQWEKEYWHAAQLILAIQKKDLADWIGAEIAAAPRQLLKELDNAISSAVQNRIKHASDDFKDKHKDPSNREKIIKESKTERPWKYYDNLQMFADEYADEICPACSCQGVVGGFLWHEEIIDADHIDYDLEIVERTFTVEEFFCPYCNLKLDGLREVEAANIKVEFFTTDERARVFQPEYGND